jgi:chitinase
MVSVREARRLRVVALLCTSAILLVFSAMRSSPAHSDESFSVIAYVHGEASNIDKYPIDKLTQLNYSFLHLSGNRLVVGNTRDSTGILRLISLKKQNPRLKVILSVRGWGGCESCSNVFSTPEGRHDCAVSAKELLEGLGADGIDLDWEYPAIEGYPGHRYAPEDRHNFTLLLRELRSVLGDRYEVSFAAGGFTTYLRNSVEWDEVMQVVDKVNLMTYDLVNGNSTVTGHHTPLHSSPSQVESTDLAVRYLDSVGVPRHKIIIGAAFYARVWEKVDPVNNGLYQPGKFRAYVNFNQLETYLDTAGTFLLFWDSTAQAPYAYDGTHRLFATFDNRRSVEMKTRYALHQRLGGIMFWELTGDKHENGFLDAIADTVFQEAQKR